MPATSPKHDVILNSMRLKEIFFCLGLLSLLLATGCLRKPDVFLPDGDLAFSSDTIFFDTIFTTLPSPTERVMVRNNSDHNILISEVKLDKGVDYSLTFDGVAANRIENYELPQGDSVLAFIKFTSEKKDEFTRDQLVFKIGEQTQKVEIEAFVYDAIFYKDSVLGGFGSGNLTVMGPDKKHLIDGCLVVADGHTLRILPGTQIYFTPRKDQNFNLESAIKVFGRLLVEGGPGQPVTFQQTRYGENYEETGGQWRGIAFASISKASLINHAIIKNGLIGVYQEYSNSGIGPKVTIKNTQIRNMGAYGVLSYGFTPFLSSYPLIRMENCLVTNCAEGTLGIYGGGYYQFIQSTFANYTVDFSRNSPQVVISNYDDTRVYLTKANFENCIIWGSEEEEFAPDSFPIANHYDVTFKASLVRTTLPLKGFNIISADVTDFPKFADPAAGEPADRNFQLTSGSPAIDLGQPSDGVFTDLRGVPRDMRPDAGCYEFNE